MVRSIVTSDGVSRRRLLQMGGLAALTLCPAAQAAAARGEERALALYNVHTDESLSRVYWARGSYILEALAEIDLFLRDWRTGDVHRIEPGLLDLLHSLCSMVSSGGTFQIISGYRSPSTNAKLAAISSGVATNSLHMRGLAIDVNLPGCQLTTLRDAAWALQQGGVGFYPRDGFLHVDLGPVRRW